VDTQRRVAAGVVEGQAVAEAVASGAAEHYAAAAVPAVVVVVVVRVQVQMAQLDLQSLFQRERFPALCRYLEVAGGGLRCEMGHPCEKHLLEARAHGGVWRLLRRIFNSSSAFA
jgi:hypothetical protein